MLAQTDWVKWEKPEVSYFKKVELKKRDYSISGENLSDVVIKSFTTAYWFFISDLDGDNCPFKPTCSRFLIDAIKETNPPQGVLMFFDRFTRDINIFNRTDKYPIYDSQHFYDPVSQYTLSESKIRYLPPHTLIQSEW